MNRYRWSAWAIFFLAILAGCKEGAQEGGGLPPEGPAAGGNIPFIDCQPGLVPSADGKGCVVPLPGPGGENVPPPPVSGESSSSTGPETPQLPPGPVSGPKIPEGLPGAPAVPNIPIAPVQPTPSQPITQPLPGPIAPVPDLPIPAQPPQPAPEGSVAVDTDADGITDDKDNCPALTNPGQVDVDGNSVGDRCDPAVVWVLPGAAPDATADGSLKKPYGSVKTAILASKQPGKAGKVFLRVGEMAEEDIVVSDGVTLLGGFQYLPGDLAWSAPHGQLCVKATMTCLTGGANGKPVITIDGAQGGMIAALHIKTISAPSLDFCYAVRVYGSAQIKQSVLFARDLAPENADSVYGLQVLAKHEGAIISVRQSEIYAGGPAGMNVAAYAIYATTANAVPGAWFTLLAEENTILTAAGGNKPQGAVHALYLSGNPKNRFTIRQNTIAAGSATLSSVGVAAGWDGAVALVLLDRNRISVGGAESSAGVDVRNAAVATIVTNGILNASIAANAKAITGVAATKAGAAQIMQNTIIAQGAQGAVSAVRLDGNGAADLRNNIAAAYPPKLEGSATIVALANMTKEKNKLYLWHNLTAPKEAAYCKNETAAMGAFSDDEIVKWGWSALKNIIGKDPLFDGVGDLFHIGGASPAVNAGIDVSAFQSPSFKWDLGGAPRPLEEAYDIGAHEVKKQP